MPRYFITVEIEYSNDDLLQYGKVRIKREFEKPQSTLELPLQLCIHDFYSKMCGYCINNIRVLAFSLN